MGNESKDKELKADDSHSTIDISLIDMALPLSYEARIDAHESARALMEDLREAGKKFYAPRPKGTA